MLSFTTQQKTTKPKLVVLIAIDGLRGDLLNKYRPAFTGGFKRLFDEGYQFTNAWVDHAVTVSHAGHETLATGNYPKDHGIVDAAFYEQSGDSLRFTDAFADSDYTLTGYPDIKSISCKKVLTPGLAEWIKQKDASAKVLCVGTGNISSALYCSHPNENVFWYSDDKGKYVSSTYFVKEYPAWVTKFNDEVLPQYFAKYQRWDNVIPPGFLHLANEDSAAFESYGEHHTFPYVASERVKKNNLMRQWIRNTPYCDDATLSFAKQGIASLAMGQTGTTDYLSIVLSQVDNTAHGFGPSSLEVFNTLFEMDRSLGDFFSYLDEKVGKGNYVVALSADHGFPEIPEQTAAKGGGGKRLGEDQIENILNTITAIEKDYARESRDVIADKIKTKLKTYDFIADVYTPAQLNDTKASGDPYLELTKKSYRKDRVPRLPFFSLKSFESPIGKAGVMVRLKQNTMIDLDAVIHGSPYDYDRFVPLFFLGGGVAKGSSGAAIKTVDVAPTLAKLAEVKIINKVDGKGVVLKGTDAYLPNLSNSKKLTVINMISIIQSSRLFLLISSLVIMPITTVMHKSGMPATTPNMLQPPCAESLTRPSISITATIKQGENM